MTSNSTRHRLLAVLLLPVLLVLAGCGKFHADFDVQDAETVNLAYDLGIDSSLVQTEYSSAEELCTDMGDSASPLEGSTPEVEPYEDDGMWGCKVTTSLGQESFGNGFDVTEESGELHLVLDTEGAEAGGVDTADVAALPVDFRMTFTFPGEVLEASGGEIDGNSVTYTDINEVTNGIDIRAESGGSFPWLIVIGAVLVLGFLLLVLLAAVAFFVIRSRRNKGGGNTPGGYGAATAGAAAGSVPPAAPQGAPPAAPQGQQWGQVSPAPAPPQGGQPWDPPQDTQGPQYGQGPQGGQQWGEASPPPAPPQGGQPWDPPQDTQGPQYGQGPQGGQPWDQPGQGQQPPQGPGW